MNITHLLCCVWRNYYSFIHHYLNTCSLYAPSKGNVGLGGRGSGGAQCDKPTGNMEGMTYVTTDRSFQIHHIGILIKCRCFLLPGLSPLPIKDINQFFPDSDVANSPIGPKGLQQPASRVEYSSRWQ